MRPVSPLAMTCIAQMLLSCASEQPIDPRTVQLYDGLTVLERGPIDGVSGTLSRSGGFAHASIVVQGPPAFPFDAVAHWQRNDGSIVTEHPADRRRFVTGPAGIGTLGFTAPSAEASHLMIELAPAGTGEPTISRF
jgi:hypothetical protein